MGGLVLSPGDLVNVDVEGAGRCGVESQVAEPRLLRRLPERDLLAGGLAPIGMAPRLKPSVELAMVEQEDLIARGRDDDRAPGQMAFQDPPIEGVGVALDEVDDAIAILSLCRVDTGVGSKGPRQGGERWFHPGSHDGDSKAISATVAPTP